MTTTTMNVMTQTDEDDMPEYTSIYDRPKRPRGRPKNQIQLTDEEQKERMRRLSSTHYMKIFKKKIATNTKCTTG